MLLIRIQYILFNFTDFIQRPRLPSFHSCKLINFYLFTESFKYRVQWLFHAAALFKPYRFVRRYSSYYLSRRVILLYTTAGGYEYPSLWKRERRIRKSTHRENIKYIYIYPRPNDWLIFRSLFSVRERLWHPSCFTRLCRLLMMC